MKRLFVLICIALIGALCLSGCAEQPEASDDLPEATYLTSADTGEAVAANEVTLRLVNSKFVPDVINAKAGEELTIEITNTDDAEHYLNIDEFEVDERVMAGQSIDVTIIPSAGEYQFYCKLHSGMTGTLVVE